MGILFYVVCFLSLTAHSQGFIIQNSQVKPSFCRTLDCPEYKVVNKTDDFEERCYPTYKWASTDMYDVDYQKATETGFFRLFAYISGANKQKVKIPMTAPVAVQIKAGPGPFCASNFTENFFVPFKNQENPPEPTDEKVYISTFKEHCQYVISYSGYSNDTQLRNMAIKLAKALDKADLGSTYYDDYYFFAGYDSPYEIQNRHNEVWFIKKSDKVIN